MGEGGCCSGGWDLDDQGSQEVREEVVEGDDGGGGCCGCGCWCWLGRDDEDWASFMSMSMNMAISRSAGSAGGVWVGGVAAGGAGAVESGGGGRPSLEPSGLGDGEEDDQNQVMVRAGFEMGWLVLLRRCCDRGV